MQRRSRMQGLTMWGWLFVLMVGISALTLVMRLGPHYFDNNSVRSILDGITVEEAKGPKSQLRKLIDKRFTVNGLRDLDAKRDVSIERTREATTVTIAYEVREHIVGNIYAVLSFNDQRDF